MIIKIPFWAKETGNFMTHKDGLSKETLDRLTRLKEGDRLILYNNNTAEGGKYSSTSPDLVLKLYEKREDSDR